MGFPEPHVSLKPKTRVNAPLFSDPAATGSVSALPQLMPWRLLVPVMVADAKRIPSINNAKRRYTFSTSFIMN